MLDKEVEDHLNFVRSLNLSLKDFYEYVMANFTEEELIAYKDKLYKETIINFRKAGKEHLIQHLKQRNAAYENRRILTKGIKNTFLDN